MSGARFIDNNQILSCSGDSSILLWDIERGSPIRAFKGHLADVECIDINKDKSIFVSGSIDATAKVWDYRNKDAIFTFKGHHSDINCVSWFPDGNAFATGSDDATVRLFDLKACQQMNCYQNEDIYASVMDITFSKSGYYLLTAYDEEPFCVAWNTMTAGMCYSLGDCGT